MVKVDSGLISAMFSLLCKFKRHVLIWLILKPIPKNKITSSLDLLLFLDRIDFAE